MQEFSISVPEQKKNSVLVWFSGRKKTVDIVAHID